MSSALPYGVNMNVALDLPPEVLLRSSFSPRGRPLADLASAVDAALASPQDFPPVEQMVVPGDRVTVALEVGVPQASILVRSVVDRLTTAGIAPENITVLFSSQGTLGEGGASPVDLSSVLDDQVTLATHDPKNQQNMAFLGVSPYRHPVYLNRALVEADAVVLIAAAQLDSALGYHGLHASLYPTYSDELVLRRFRSPKAIEPGDQCDDRIRREVETVGRLLGMRFTVQVVPGLGEQVMHVVAGDVDAVEQRGQQLCRDTWRHNVPRRANLVVATISGPNPRQTWEALGRAMSNAMQVVEENGMVVVCTDLDQPLGPGMRAIVDHADPQDAVPWIRRTRPVDIMPALALARLLDHARVFLLSNLDDTVVDDLGMAVVSDPAEVTRLVSRNASCLLLADAHRLSVREAVE